MKKKKKKKKSTHSTSQHYNRSGRNVCYRMKFVVEERQPGKERVLSRRSVQDYAPEEDEYGNDMSWKQIASIALTSKSETLLFTSVRKKSPAQVWKGSVTVPERNLGSLKKKGKKKLRKKLVKTKTNVAKESAGGRTCLRYLQAARYFRENACGMVHPTGKLKLYGLMMQICCGDYLEEEADEIISESSAEKDYDDNGDVEASPGGKIRSRLQGLKKAAWKRELGKKQDECQKEYVEMISQLIPNWRADRLFRMRDQDSEQPTSTRRKRKELSWILRFDTIADLGGAADGEDRVRIKAKHVHVLQSDNSANWFVHFRSGPRQSSATRRRTGSGHCTGKPRRRLTVLQSDEAKKRGVAPWVLEHLGFSSSISRLSRQNMILDKAKHLALKDQDWFFYNSMVAQARSSEGWASADLSNLSGAVQSREIPESSRLQYRTRAKVRSKASDLNKFIDGLVGELKPATMTTMFTDMQSQDDLEGDWVSISRTLEHAVFELP